MARVTHQTHIACAIALLSLAIALALTACVTAEATKPVIAASFANDGDRDGIDNDNDECVNTPAPQPVNDVGCPIFSGPLAGLDFPANSSDLGSAARQRLDQLVQQLNAYPEVILELEGHTDNRGSGIRNLELSKQRVMAVVRYLVARGVAPQRLRPYGFGESRPRVKNATEEGRRENRRIEVSVFIPKSDVPAQPDAENG